MTNDASSQSQQVTSPESTEPTTPSEERQAVLPQDSHAEATSPEARVATPTASGRSLTQAPELSRAAQMFQRYLLPFLLPPLLLLVITTVVVALGSGLLLLGTSDLQFGPVIVAKAVVAAGLGVLVIGSGALWLATRA